MKYDPLTRILHLLVALGVTMQMLTSLVMVHPKPGRLPNEWFEIHEIVGIALLAVVSAHWLWAIARSLGRGEHLMLFPWLSRRRLSVLYDDGKDLVKDLGQGRFPTASQPKALPSAIQGIGLLLALFLAATGTALSVGAAPNGGLSPSLRVVKEVHEAMAPLMWAYLVAHPLLGLLHQFAGHRSLNRMFGLGADRGI